ncbi:type VI secretion system baseplate subunit TssG [Catenovulum sp. SM1970]|uniref:type VI secretion system baseplate subunit TssG n=1 Tax=Marinifaba aquimaris TaxID=2741323 RepID=UPI001573A5C6|nr:type VI secretion system baseplate subunit TssG [Marinifaba aquimaris]NTS77914.1 type VI secretion system baseplate subunit TssG [Marinifaba aquimaris]
MNSFRAKLPGQIDQLLNEPWTFSFFKALTLLEQHMAIDGEMTSGDSQAIHVTPHKEMCFPASDLRDCKIDSHTQLSQQKLRVETSYQGLYGVDGSLPHYVLEQAARDDFAGEVTRAFLDMFNHLLYCQTFQAWKKSQLNIKGYGSEQFDLLLDSILASAKERRIHTSIASLKQNSASGLLQLLKLELDIDCIELNDKEAYWQPIDSPFIFGQEHNSVLGESTILGEQILVSGGRVKVVIGPLDAELANEYRPNHPMGKKLNMLLTSQLPNETSWSCDLLINQAAQPVQVLGQDTIALGQGLFVGDSQASQIKQTYQMKQFH